MLNCAKPDNSVNKTPFSLCSFGRPPTRPIKLPKRFGVMIAVVTPCMTLANDRKNDKCKTPLSNRFHFIASNDQLSIPNSTVIEISAPDSTDH